MGRYFSVTPATRPPSSLPVYCLSVWQTKNHHRGSHAGGAGLLANTPFKRSSKHRAGLMEPRPLAQVYA